MNARTEIPLGIFHGVPIADYHASAGISNSGLGDFAKSPLHYHALHLNPDRPAVEETPAQLVGNLAHCATLEPEAFGKRYVVGPNCRRGTKLWDAFEASLTSDQTGVKPDQAETAMAQALSIRSIPDVAQLLAAGRPEVSAFWIDPATGELCRCRPDWVHPVGDDSVVLVDVKTVGSADAREFSLQAARMRYAHQAAFYADGYATASGQKVLGMVFVCVETSWPFAAAAYMLPDEWVEIARTETAALLQRFAECRTTEIWPGYASGVQLLTMPKWVVAAHE